VPLDNVGNPVTPTINVVVPTDDLSQTSVTGPDLSVTGGVKLRARFKMG
jgi:hypothetical protein